MLSKERWVVRGVGSMCVVMELVVSVVRRW